MIFFKIFQSTSLLKLNTLQNLHILFKDILSRLIREQKRQVSKVLLDGLHDLNSPLSKLRGVRREIIGEIIWEKMLVKNWQVYSDSGTFSDSESDFDSALYE